jgi:hypothetical protein
MFGRGRFQNGVIILPKPEYAFEPSNEHQLSAFRTEIWPTVERMNAYAPQHSRLFKEMIIVASPSKPFSFTAKGTTRRGAIISEYDPEIEAVYKSVEESAQNDIAVPAEWNATTAHEFIGKTVHAVLKQKLKDDDDFFQYGCDRYITFRSSPLPSTHSSGTSLQATWIRNTITRVLRDVATESKLRIPFDLVYQNPTISALVKWTTRTASATIDEATARTQKAKEMAEVVEKYSTNFPAHVGTEMVRPQDGQVVVLTGTTGGLGSTLLAALYASQGVRKVFALNRRSTKGDSLRERQRHGLLDRGLDDSLVDSEKVVLLEGDMTLPDFGLEQKVFEEVRLTLIIDLTYFNSSW